MNSKAYVPPHGDKRLETPLEGVLKTTLQNVEDICSKSQDVVIHPIQVQGVDCAVLSCEGLVDTKAFSTLLANPLSKLTLENPSAEKVMTWIREQSMMAPDQKVVTTYFELFRFLMSGFVIVLVDTVREGAAMGIQGFPGRSPGEPQGEQNIRGSRESFNEMLRPNLGMIRRRYKTPDLVFESVTLGQQSKTDGALIYVKSAVSNRLLEQMRSKLNQVNMSVVLESGYVQPLLEGKPFSLIGSTGYTERPDTLCAKIAEGRIALLLDGSPYALIVPYLFWEHLQSFDDYAHRPYFATFIRLLKLFSMLFAVFLPGIYVALGRFHPELLPRVLLEKLVQSSSETPFPLVGEAIVVFFLYEIMREAGLRMPRPVGHAVSIVGALVIGDAAVTAGIIGSPMVLVVALTAIASFVVPTMYEPVTILRLGFILLGGWLGLLGILAGICVVLVNLMSVNCLGLPVTAPGTPFVLYGMRDTLFRAPWSVLGKRDLRVEELL